MNDRRAAFDDQVDLYLQCAAGLANSLRSHDIRFELLTNDPSDVAARCRGLGIQEAFPAVELECRTTLPPGTPFFSAHFKWDAYDHLAGSDKPYVGLIDLDMIAVNHPPVIFAKALARRLPICYEITEQVVPAYGHDVVLEDLRKLDPVICEPRWYGGEFIAGPPLFFRELSSRVRPLVDRYIPEIPTLHHVSDETVTTAVLARMAQDGQALIDGGKERVIGRFWSVPTLHKQRRLNSHSEHFLLHLPSDKTYLAKMSRAGVRGREFLRRYALHYRLRHLRRIGKRLRRVATLLKG